MKHEPSNREILEAVNGLRETAIGMQGSISGLQKNVTGLQETMDDMQEAMQDFSSHVDGQFQEVRAEIGSIKAQMVTKSYLDDKLADLKGDTVALVRKEDKKVNKLIEVLGNENVLSQSAAKDVMSHNVFPQ